MLIDDIGRGVLGVLFPRCRNIWASLPGAGYGRAAQSRKLVTVWRTAGGVGMKVRNGAVCAGRARSDVVRHENGNLSAPLVANRRCER